MVAGVFIEDGQILLFKKRPGLSNAGLWEFPGGKIEEHETPPEALKREIAEELGIQVEVHEHIRDSFFAKANKVIQLMAYRVQLIDGQIQLKDHDAHRWFSFHEVKSKDLAPADIPIFEHLRDQISGAGGG